MDFDVAIVGGGPAGCSCAITLLSRGHSVAVVTAPSRKEKPTETATPALKQILRSLNSEAALSACEPCFGIVSSWGRTAPVLQPSLMDPSGHAWFINRTRFDTYLQAAAREAGARWIDATAQTVGFDARGVSITTTRKPVRARWLIAASGSPSWPARITRQALSNVDLLIAFWAHLPVVLEGRLLFVESTEYGWWYVSPGDGDFAIACFVTDPSSARAIGAGYVGKWNDLFRATMLSRRIGSKATAKAIHAALTGLAALPQKHGSNWIAVGDAAMKLDPIGSSGIATALDSGRRAARAVADRLGGNEAGTEEYGRWSTGLVQEFARQRVQHYALEAGRRVGGFWTRRLTSERS